MLFSGVYALWDDPLIVSCLDGMELAAALRIPGPADVIVHPAWLPTLRTLPRLVRNALQGRRRGKRLHFMCCSDDSNRLLRRLGIPGALVSISSYINEHTYRITGVEKRYDAVYAARMAPYKRLYLASRVRSLYVQTYGDYRTAEGEYDLHRYEPGISHCDFNRRWISQDEIVDIFNRARTGLSLSKCEGAMLASVEYMLCGLPQVSTRCRGGREQFFDPRYVRVVDATPDAVAAGVNELIGRNIDPQLVRNETLEKLRSHRERLCEYVIRIVQRRGGEPPTTKALYERIFGTDRGARSCFVHVREFAQRGFN